MFFLFLMVNYWSKYFDFIGKGLFYFCKNVDNDGRNFVFYIEYNNIYLFWVIIGIFFLFFLSLL